MVRHWLLPRNTTTDYLWLLGILACLYYPFVHLTSPAMVPHSLLRINLEGKVAIITGGNTGIGYETALQLVRQNATVVIASRSLGRVTDAVSRLLTEVPSALGRVEGIVIDLSSLPSIASFVRSFMAHHKELHFLINNAGIMTPPRTTVEGGHESQFATNHLGHFLLTELLIDMLQKSAPARIVLLSSSAHQWGYIDFNDLNGESQYYFWGVSQYGNSKLANVLYARELAERLEGTNVVAVSVHPGVVRTELFRHWGVLSDLFDYVKPPLSLSSWEGAQTTLHAILSPEIPGNNGEYFANCAVQGSWNTQFNDMKVARELSRVSRQLTSLSPL